MRKVAMLPMNIVAYFKLTSGSSDIGLQHSNQLDYSTKLNQYLQVASHQDGSSRFGIL